MYTMLVTEKYSFGNTDNKEDDAYKYKRYKLSDHKTFKSLFFPQKEMLLSLLDDFSNKRGKYAVEGFPHKLGLLLHGPPGTGKTSLIKALAQATGRSIINVPLAQVKTNQMLMDVMYDLKLKVDGADAPALGFKDVLFVIEDVDAASKVVLRRDDAASAGPKGKLDEPSNDQLKAIVSSLSRSARGAPTTGEADEGPPAVMGPKQPGSMGDIMSDLLLKPRADELSLAGVLNVLDGVVDTPGRLLILTSNHPEALDPALIRPGRVDHQLHLGYLQPEDAIAMISHYFASALDDAQRARTTPILAGATKVTPAMLEQLCARHETIEALLDDLEDKVSDWFGVQDPATAIKRQVSGG